MRPLLPVLFLILASAFSQGGQLPFTCKEISLMLRSGYSSPTVMLELGKRHFADALDSEKEESLVKAGATPELIESLKRGAYAVPPGELAAAREELSRRAVRDSLQTEKSRHADAAFQAKVARERSRAAATRSDTASSVISDSIKGDLVRCQNGSIVRAEEEAAVGKKLIALYFSAHWCPPCRKFTPELVDFYNRVAPQHPEFEVIFVSNDRSASAMQTYMSETSMPWPAIDFDRIASKDSIRKYCGSGIPCLVLVDASGKVLSDSFAGKDYLGPEKVLADLDTMFAGRQVAQGR